MLEKRGSTFPFSCCLFIILLFPAAALSFAADQPRSLLQEEDCGKCHWFQLNTLKNQGGRHFTEVGCMGCHPQHTPEEEDTILACASCHTDEPHFLVEDCQQCHADPHKPLISLQDPFKPARKECLSCHAGVGQQMQASASRHAELFCTRCHDRHGFIPECRDCHNPHLATQENGDCLRCHPAHRPLQIVPAGWIPAAYCQACHSREGRNLASTRTLHGGVNCVHCHNGQHPSTTSCRECHGLPHDRELHRKYRRCLTDCHGDAHELLSNR
ncbi:MAG: hypothetical protein SCH71_04650 [Desulfobulbaceae bacterium]|nr:hypothetical protein [Desulfobulbaceae bacterium]